jgi:hypothetical protein
MVIGQANTEVPCSSCQVRFAAISAVSFFAMRYAQLIFSFQTGLVIACYVTGVQFPQEWKIEVARYLANLQRQGEDDDDRGWGM